MARQDKEREAELQPKRIETAKTELAKLNIEIIFEDETTLQFMFNGAKITFYPYSGWFSGKWLKDGRGLKNLLKQIELLRNMRIASEKIKLDI